MGAIGFEPTISEVMSLVRTTAPLRSVMRLSAFQRYLNRRRFLARSSRGNYFASAGAELADELELTLALDEQ